MSESKNCIDVVKPLTDLLVLDNRLREGLHGSYYMIGQSPIVQIIGGVNTAALEHPETVIDVENKEIIAPESLHLPTYRADGTLRDLDILVQSDDKTSINHVDKLAKQIIGDSLDVSAFGYKSGEILESQIKHPFGFIALKTFLSDRYCMSDETMQKALFPFAVEMDQASLETWSLLVGDTVIPVPNPAISAINYTNRSISGVRPKDRAKIDRMTDVVFNKAPELKDWAVDGPGASQVALGGLLRSLLPNKNHPNYFGLSERRLTKDDLAEHDMFMVPELSHESKRRIVAAAAIKASILSFGESNPFIVSFWQRHIERNIDTIVKNEV